MQDRPSNKSPEEVLYEKYRAVGWQPGGELLLRHRDALRYIRDCEKLGLVILGMDFYVQKDGGIAEVNSTAWSSINEGPDAFEQTIAAAWELIKDGLPDKAEWVSFVVSEPSTR